MIQEVPIGADTLDRFAQLIGEAELERARQLAGEIRERMQGHVWYNINSTAKGGGVAELLRTLPTYARGAGIDVRWLVISGTPEFFRITKRLHNALHGSPGDGSPLDQAARETYEAVLRENALHLEGIVRPGDVVLLHDPQTAGLTPYLAAAGALVIWRSHIGHEEADEQSTLGWRFLQPYLEHARAAIFSREAYIPSCCRHKCNVIIQPSIDPFSPKNQDMDEETVRAILVQTGLVEDGAAGAMPIFQREDGSPGRVDRGAEVIRRGRAALWDTPLVVQVSRWDTLKDPLGVMNGFRELLLDPPPSLPGGRVELVLAAPAGGTVADDPEAAQVFEQVLSAWRELSDMEQDRIHLASLPMEDVEENAAIVNALQRHAAVIVQKSLQEGFGLTVTEAMWKGRPVVASAVGGITDQIEDGVHGLLLRDPRDTKAFAGALHRILSDTDLARTLGVNARERARQKYLGLRHLVEYADLLGELDRNA